MPVAIIQSGLDDVLKFVTDLPELAAEAAFLAINDASRDAVPTIKREMRKQVNFPAGYLGPERLSIKRKATRVNLQAVISARDRPTSLARFVENATSARAFKKPLKVKVSRNGGPVVFKRSNGEASAFLLTLRNGNTGLAIRLPKGEAPSAAYAPVPLTVKGGQETGLWLLYGPSVDQVMKGVIPDVEGEITQDLSDNFKRQLSRLMARG